MRNPPPIPERQPSLDLGIDPPALIPEVLPSGRKRQRGKINRGYRWLQTRVREQGEDLLDALLAAALAGEPAAMRLAFEYGWGLPRKMPIPVDLPATTNATELQEFIRTLLMRTAAGEIGPEEGEHLMRMAYIALQVSDKSFSGTPVIQSGNTRGILAERFMRAIEARRQNGNGHAESPDNANYASSDETAVSNGSCSDELERKFAELRARYDGENGHE